VGIRENIQRVRERIERAALRAGRNPGEIRLMGATKTVPPEKIREAYGAGLRLFGENRVQEGIRKIQELKDLPIEFHFIGVLQSNKVRKAVENFSAVHSVSSLKLARKISSAALQKGISYPVFFELNLGAEESKSGFSEKEFFSSLEELSSLSNLKPLGLMTIPPLGEDPQPYFIRLREILEEVKGVFGPQFKELSMGMSDDYEIAVEEGATILRIGRAIFGERK